MSNNFGVEVIKKDLLNAVSINDVYYVEQFMKRHYLRKWNLDQQREIYIPAFLIACQQNKYEIVEIICSVLNDTFVLTAGVFKLEIKKAQEHGFNKLEEVLKIYLEEDEAFNSFVKEV